MNNQKILDLFLEKIGLFDSVFGNNTEKIIINRERETAKRTLKDVFHYERVDLLFPSQIDDERMGRTLDTMFRFNNQNMILENQNLEVKK